MRVLLTNPPTESAVRRVLGVTGPPLGLAYLASAIRDEHEVSILDCVAEDLSLQDVSKRIKKFDPDVIGITSTTSSVYDAYSVARIAKELNEEVFVVMGGPHVTFTPERTMRECPQVDAIVRGEGEETFRELISSLDSGKKIEGILGLSYRRNGKIINEGPRPLIKNLDDLPIPSYDLLPMEKYKAEGIPFGTQITSRGCPFNCIFCSSSLQFGKVWRGHSVERVIEELSILRNEYGIREIEFLDDTFTLNKKRAMEISRKIREENLDVSWSASSRVDTIDRDLAEEVKRGGCHTIYLGIESGSQKTLDFIDKGIKLEDSIRAVKILKRAGLRVLGSFIIGFPEETIRDINTTIEFSKRVGVDFAQFTIATPYPGTRLWEYAVKEKIILTFDWRKYTTLDPVMRLKHLTPEQISKLLRKAYISFYLRPRVMIRNLIENRFLFRKVIRGVINLVASKLGKSLQI
mgnify:CR=1 FL=1